VSQRLVNPALPRKRSLDAYGIESPSGRPHTSIAACERRGDRDREARALEAFPWGPGKEAASLGSWGFSEYLRNGLLSTKRRGEVVIKYYSTREVCGILGVSEVTIYKWIRKRRFEPPPVRKIAGVRVRAWAEQDIERARAVLKKQPQGN
jgi:predicted DNA-binding transcriptional regulator AlpA